MSRKQGNNDGFTSVLALIFISIFAMPLVGIYFLTSKNDKDKAIGIVMLIVGVIIWLILALIK